MKACLVLGGAACVWDDVNKALEIGEYEAVVTCNDATVFWPGPIEAAVSLHGDKWPRWLAQRAARGYPAPSRVFGHLELRKAHKLNLVNCITDYAEFRYPEQKSTGSSGQFAMKVALEDLGYDRVVLCGIPMDDMNHFFDKEPWQGASAHRRGWTTLWPRLKKNVRSMSGWTRKNLGAPDEDWLTGDS